MAGAYPLPAGGFHFAVIHNKEHGWFVWEGETVPDQFKQADGHIYELLWDDTHVEVQLIEENVRLKLLPKAIWPITTFLFTEGSVNFYSLRNRIREVGGEASRTDWEKRVVAVAPYIKVGA